MSGGNTSRLTRSASEYGKHVVCVQINFDAHIFVSNAAAAFGLNMAVFLLIGKTSALTMNIAGVIKDWLLIALSVLIFKAQASHTHPHATSTLLCAA